MLGRDLDVVNFLEMVKDYNMMKQVLFDENDRFLLRHQQKNMICTSSSEDLDKSNSIF